jgi:hypothetical protein
LLWALFDWGLFCFGDFCFEGFFFGGFGAFGFQMKGGFLMWESLGGKRIAEGERIAERELLKGNCWQARGPRL